MRAELPEVVECVSDIMPFSAGIMSLMPLTRSTTSKERRNRHPVQEEAKAYDGVPLSAREAAGPSISFHVLEKLVRLGEGFRKRTEIAIAKVAAPKSGLQILTSSPALKGGDSYGAHEEIP
jgi:hypothetical protein